MNRLYEADMKRYGEGRVPFTIKMFHYFFRKVQSTTPSIARYIYIAFFKFMRSRYRIGISYNAQIGPGLYLGHPYNITINPRAVIGKNVNIHKGVTIGQENRGKRKGAPTIGDCVWIGINAVIVGNITVGNDVLIAANSFVNCDVPDHSVVYGNPCVIKHRENATEGYINNTI